MFGVGWTEILVILVVALLVLGPNKLPEIAKGLGKGIRDFRKAMNSLEDIRLRLLRPPGRPRRRRPPPPSPRPRQQRSRRQRHRLLRRLPLPSQANLPRPLPGGRPR